MSTIDTVFTLLDEWRHLPDYQLERRADIFFAAYLPDFLAHHMHLDARPLLIPEFPLRLGTIYPDSTSNQSCKVDYLAITQDRSRAFLVELKTDARSRRDRQDDYLVAAVGHGLQALLGGLLDIVCASEHKHKYCCLLRLLGKHSLLTVSSALSPDLIATQFRSEVRACVIPARNPKLEVLYIQPHAQREDEIGFVDFAKWLASRNDPIASRFAMSLHRWTSEHPGQPSRC